jgi:hypothetical protein
MDYHRPFSIAGIKKRFYSFLWWNLIQGQGVRVIPETGMPE